MYKPSKLIISYVEHEEHISCAFLLSLSEKEKCSIFIWERGKKKRERKRKKEKCTTRQKKTSFKQKTSLIHANSDKLIDMAPLEDALLSWHPLQFPWCCIPSAPASSASFPHWLKPHQQIPMRRLAVDVVIILYVLQCTCDWRVLHSVHRCLQNICIHVHKGMKMSSHGKCKDQEQKMWSHARF